MTPINFNDLPIGARRAVHRTPNYQCDWCRDSMANPRCTAKATRKWGNHWFCEEHGKRMDEDLTRNEVKPWAAHACPITTPKIETAPSTALAVASNGASVVRSDAAPSLVIRISGQIRGGKNNMTVTRTGKHIPKAPWAAWRDEAVREVIGQLPATWQPICAPVAVTLEYVAQDRRRRDQPAILDSIFHVLEKAGVVTDDTFLWVTHSTRERDKARAGATITIL